MHRVARVGMVVGHAVVLGRHGADGAVRRAFADDTALAPTHLLTGPHLDRDEDLLVDDAFDRHGHLADDLDGHGDLLDDDPLGGHLHGHRHVPVHDPLDRDLDADLLLVRHVHLVGHRDLDAPLDEAFHDPLHFDDPVDGHVHDAVLVDDFVLVDDLLHGNLDDALLVDNPLHLHGDLHDAIDFDDAILEDDLGFGRGRRRYRHLHHLLHRLLGRGRVLHRKLLHLHHRLLVVDLLDGDLDHLHPLVRNLLHNLHRHHLGLGDRHHPGLLNLTKLDPRLHVLHLLVGREVGLACHLLDERRDVARRRLLVRRRPLIRPLIRPRRLLVPDRPRLVPGRLVRHGRGRRHLVRVVGGRSAGGGDGPLRDYPLLLERGAHLRAERSVPLPLARVLRGCVGG
mmetsp:Transcript_25447/g.58089  ORF Transcript_25447/g.58089 Transcript_25447/m.58089 type:complete len:397 (+) Transcript_25447:669-1859(+)